MNRSKIVASVACLVLAGCGEGSDTKSSATSTRFDNGNSDLDATDVQAAIDELVDRIATLDADLAEAEATIAALMVKTSSMSTATIDGVPAVVFQGVNVHVRSGVGSTEGQVNGTGNLVIGYNELRSTGNFRTGSHNLVLGTESNFTSYGGIVSGETNDSFAPHASLVGGRSSSAYGDYSVVVGGRDQLITNAGDGATITGGRNHQASGLEASVTGGDGNTAAGSASTVNGGQLNGATATNATAGGGAVRIADAADEWVAGGLTQAN